MDVDVSWERNKEKKELTNKMIAYISGKIFLILQSEGKEMKQNSPMETASKYYQILLNHWQNIIAEVSLSNPSYYHHEFSIADTYEKLLLVQVICTGFSSSSCFRCIVVLMFLKEKKYFVESHYIIKCKMWHQHEALEKKKNFKHNVIISLVLIFQDK